MKKFCGGVLTVVMMGHLLQELSGQCQSSGFSGCEFNIMKACDAQGNPRPNFRQQIDRLLSIWSGTVWEFRRQKTKPGVFV